MAESVGRVTRRKQAGGMTREQIEKLETVFLVGAQMSNLCFNLGQSLVTIDDRGRAVMRDLRAKWDTSYSIRMEAIAALRASDPPQGTADRQCAVCRATYPQGGQHAGSQFALSIAGRLVCKRCVNVGRDARIAAESAPAVGETPTTATPCAGNDPLCPCQDGDSCHYRDTATTKAMPAAPTAALTTGQLVNKLQLAMQWVAASHGVHQCRQLDLAKVYLTEVLRALTSPVVAQDWTPRLTETERAAIAATVQGPAPVPVEYKPRYNRDTAHRTFNGGWDTDETRRAFHHGMDTVFNLIEKDALRAALLVPEPPDLVALVLEWQDALEAHEMVGHAESDADALAITVRAADTSEKLRAWTPRSTAPAPDETRERWQPIETAPKDETRILLWRDDWDYAPVGWWDDHVDSADGPFGGWQIDESLHLPNAVQEGFIGWTEDEDAMPTHWSPLPSAPALVEPPAPTDEEH